MNWERDFYKKADQLYEALGTIDKLKAENKALRQTRAGLASVLLQWVEFDGDPDSEEYIEICDQLTDLARKIKANDLLAVVDKALESTEGL